MISKNNNSINYTVHVTCQLHVVWINSLFTKTDTYIIYKITLGQKHNVHTFW